MDGLKNLIARRRPSAAPKDQEAPARPAQKAQATTSDTFQDHDLQAAQQARDNVPTPQRPQADAYPDWSKPRTRLAQPSEEPQMKRTRERSQPVQKIWNLEAQSQTQVPAERPRSKIGGARPDPAPAAPPPVSAPSPASRSVSERAKTRLLGFHSDGPVQDVFAGQEQAPAQANPQFPIGWIVVIDGPGCGASFTLTAGLSTVGRDADQTVSLDFGDASISRHGHLSIAYDEEERAVFVGHGGKQNIVRKNDKPLLSTEELANGDRLKIGKTELRFVALCGPDFSWGARHNEGAEDG